MFTEAERKVAITLQLIPDQQNKSVTKSIEDQVNAIEAGIIKIAQDAVKKRSDIYKKEAEDRYKFEKQAERRESDQIKAQEMREKRAGKLMVV